MVLTHEKSSVLTIQGGCGDKSPAALIPEKNKKNTSIAFCPESILMLLKAFFVHLEIPESVLFIFLAQCMHYVIFFLIKSIVKRCYTNFLK